VIFEDLNDEYRGHVSLGIWVICLLRFPMRFGISLSMAHDTWEYDNARETFSHPSPDPYMMHYIPLDEGQFVGISYEHSHTPYASISCDYCDFFYHDVNTCPLLGRPHRLEALAVFNREISLQSLLKAYLSLGSPALEARSCDDFDVRSEASIHLGHDFYDDTHSDDLEVSSDPSSPFAYTSPLETNTPLDTSEDVPIIPDLSLLLAPLGEFGGGDGFETDASFNDQCGLLVESKDTFFEEHSLDEPFDVEFSEVLPHMGLDDPISDESTLDLAPSPPIPSFSSPFPIFLPSLDPLKSTFIGPETFVLDNPCIDQILNDSGIEGLEDHFEVKDFTLRPLLN